jgi:hypothetical protein
VFHAWRARWSKLFRSAVRLVVLAQHRVDACEMPRSLRAEPCEHIGIDAQVDGFLGPGREDKFAFSPVDIAGAVLDGHALDFLFGERIDPRPVGFVYERITEPIGRNVSVRFGVRVSPR